MKTLIKTSLLTGAFLLCAGNAMALSIGTIDVGESVTMTAPAEGENYVMTDDDGISYHTFCVEIGQHFSRNGVYEVESIGNETMGGGNNDGAVGDNGGDPISDESLWLYASYFEGLFGDRSGALANQVQNAIWFAEDEITADGDYNTFTEMAFDTALGSYDYSVTGWEIEVVNLRSWDDIKDEWIDNQSQLVGVAPVPEPATMLLFGTGLVGLVGLRRRNKK